MTLALLLLLVAGGGTATAVTVEDLYQAQTLVTGQGEANRVLGFGRCLRDVVVKVSGDPRLAEDRRVDALAGEAATAVRDFRYRDLLEGIPIHDEQGSRDRPYELTVDFEPAKIDAALRNLDHKPWTADRPRLLLLVEVRNGAANYLLASDGERGIDQREALLAASKQRGVPIVLPSRSALAEAGVSPGNLRSVATPVLDAAAHRMGADLALSGRMSWDAKMPGWLSTWRLISADRPYEWPARAATFDDTFRAALGGAAQILSGQGAPK